MKILPNLRYYQKEAYESIQDFTSRSIDPVCVKMATGSGKSWVIAAVSEWMISKVPSKKVLCIAPSAQLVTQNREKFLTTGFPASVYSASAGRKDLRHNVIFATPRSIEKALHKIGDVSMIIVDECEVAIESTLRLYKAIQQKNPLVRLVGTTATPFRMGAGYIFRQAPDGTMLDESEARDPLFFKLVYETDDWHLVSEGYLSRPIFGGTSSDLQYDRAALEKNSSGLFTQKSIDKAYLGKGRLTSSIVADIVEKTNGLAGGVMIFSASVHHAEEIAESLPKDLTVVIHGGKCCKADIKKFSSGAAKYNVSVGKQTTGVDYTHVQCVAVMRATESAGLFMQIVGRGMRIDKGMGKKEFLLLDYAGNVGEHFPEGDLFKPEIKVIKENKKGKIKAECELCGYENAFSIRENPGDHLVNKNGYFIDKEGNPIISAIGPVPAHYGRRCENYIKLPGQKEHSRCHHRWTEKKCDKCGVGNDIAARRCSSCGHELVDPNEKLLLANKQKPQQRQQKVIKSIERHVLTDNHKSRSGATCIVVTIIGRTESKASENVRFYMPKEGKMKFRYERYQQALKKSIIGVRYTKDAAGYVQPEEWITEKGAVKA